MRRLDDKCTVESFNLLEIMLVGRAVSAVVHEFYPEGVPPENSRGNPDRRHAGGRRARSRQEHRQDGADRQGLPRRRSRPRLPGRYAGRRHGAEAASGVLISGLISSIVPQVRRVRPRPAHPRTGQRLGGGRRCRAEAACRRRSRCRLRRRKCLRRRLATSRRVLPGPRHERLERMLAAVRFTLATGRRRPAAVRPCRALVRHPCATTCRTAR